MHIYMYLSPALQEINLLKYPYCYIFPRFPNSPDNMSLKGQTYFSSITAI